MLIHLVLLPVRILSSSLAVQRSVLKEKLALIDDHPADFLQRHRFVFGRGKIDHTRRQLPIFFRSMRSRNPDALSISTFLDDFETSRASTQPWYYFEQLTSSCRTTSKPNSSIIL